MLLIRECQSGVPLVASKRRSCRCHHPRISARPPSRAIHRYHHLEAYVATPPCRYGSRSREGSHRLRGVSARAKKARAARDLMVAHGDFSIE